MWIFCIDMVFLVNCLLTCYLYEEENVDADTIYIYTDEEGKQHRVKIVGEPYQKTMGSGKVDLEWYWAQRNEQIENDLRAKAIKAGRDEYKQTLWHDYMISRARLVIDGRKVEGGYSVFQGVYEVGTCRDLASLLKWLNNHDAVIEDDEDINNIKGLWDVPEEYIGVYVGKYKDESGTDKQKSEFANGYSEFVDLIDLVSREHFTDVALASLIRASEADAEAAVAIEESTVVQEEGEHNLSDESSESSSSESSSSDEDE